MLFSVIIPTYNRVGFIPRTLRTVSEQSFKDLEAIVTDDGSTDGTLDYLKSLGPRVEVLTQSNKGPGAARNLGAAHANGEYLAFLDSDDLWFPWTLEAFAKLIAEFNRPAILSANLIEFSDETQLGNVQNMPVRADYFSDYFASSRLGYFVGAGMAVLRRDEFAKAGGFSDQRSNAEDHDLILRMGTAPGFVQVIEPVTLAWRRHGESATANTRASYVGNARLLEQERAGKYPGGKARRKERRSILNTRTRSTSLDCLRRGLRREAWSLYRRTLPWQIESGRWKYVLGFPMVHLASFRSSNT